jgi:hypothetical protein
VNKKALKKSRPKVSSPAAARPAARRTAAPAAPAGGSAPTPVRLARVAKGKKPQYFSDPATDKLLWMTLTLMEELSVTRDRLDAVENLLEGRRVLRVADVDAYRPAGAAAQRRQAQRAAYVDRMLRAAQAELEELTGRDMPRSDAEVVAAVEA